MNAEAEAGKVLLRSLVGHPDLRRRNEHTRQLSHKPVRLASIEAAFDAAEITHGSTISFHHHYRDGDRAVAAVLDVAARRGLANLTLLCSSIFPTHACIVDHARAGVVGNIVTSYMKGPVAEAISRRLIDIPVVLQSHGGRARAIASAQVKIDLAVVGCSIVDAEGNATGRWGDCICGPLGYSMVDAKYARFAVALADMASSKTFPNAEIPYKQLDAIVMFPRPGLPQGIASGATLVRETPASRSIAETVVKVIAASGLLKEGFSFQTGSGGYSLACVPSIAAELAARKIVGGFVSGGITKEHVKLVAEGHARRIRDVQSFDLSAAMSSGENSWHSIMSAEDYASPLVADAAVNSLDVMIMGAVEIDLSFNVNVITGGNGLILGGPGGNPDTAAGSKLAIVATDLVGGGYAKVVERVSTVSTPGKFIDVLVTNDGIAVNPARTDLVSALQGADLNVHPIEELAQKAKALQLQSRVAGQGAIAAIVESREGQYLDSVRAL